MDKYGNSLKFTRIPEAITNEVAYRYYDVLVGDLAGDTNWTQVKVYLQDFHIIKKTPKGFWINLYHRRKFVLFDARKKYACLTKEEALKSFMARKVRQIRILENQLSHARQALGQVSCKNGERAE